MWTWRAGAGAQYISHEALRPAKGHINPGKDVTIKRAFWRKNPKQRLKGVVGHVMWLTYTKGNTILSIETSTFLLKTVGLIHLAQLPGKPPN